LQLGPVKASEVAEKAELERTHCYLILQSLVKKKLVIKIKPENTAATFMAESPEKIERLAKKRLKELKEILPEMKSLYQHDPDQPIIKYFEGKEGIDEIYEIVSKEAKNKNVYGIINPTAAYNKIGRILPMSIYLFDKSKIKIMDLIVRGEKAKEFKQAKEKTKFGKVKILPNNVNFDTDFLVFDNKVSLTSFKYPVHGYIIESRGIAEAMRQIHKVLWGISK
jgi:sugar-specific transcriptional regulator TrmB